MPVGEKDQVGKPGPLPGGTPGAPQDKGTGTATPASNTVPPSTTSNGANTGGKGVKRDVDYTLEFVDDLPGTPLSSGGGKPSVFEDRIADIKGDRTKHGKWARLASYSNASAAAAAANVLRQRHGLPYVEGFTFETRKVEGEGGQSRTLLFARHDPSAVEEDGKERWEKAEADRKARNEQKRKAREAELAKAGADSTTTPISPA